MEFQINALKFFAIIAVVGLHFMNRFLNSDSLQGTSSQILLVINQFFRYCVPLFVMLSGYSLSKKYINQPLNTEKFYTRRVWKILPLYIFWSYIIFFLLHYPDTSTLFENFNWINIIIWGGADYHLYFVPMIFQLYLLFPILLWLVKKFSKTTLFAVTIFQISLYGYWSYQLYLTQGNYISDQQQYIFFGSWLLYFVLGIYLNTLSDQHVKTWVRSTGILTLCSFLLVTIETSNLIKHGFDLIVATRFTKLSVLLYATNLSIWLILVRKNLFSPLTSNSQLLMKLGNSAFIIYLSHTLVIRLLWMLIDNNFSITNQTLLYIIVISCGIFLSTSWHRVQNIIIRK